ncbi:hypothetical protein ACHB0E_17390, partial [Acinetobacter baumannii]
MDSSAGKPKSGFVENRSIDFIPENERHGSIFAQFTLWFGANLQITAALLHKDLKCKAPLIEPN